MSFATVPFTFAAAAVAAPGTSVAPSAPIPMNCASVAILNTGAFTALVGIAAPGGALAAGVNATQVAPGASLTLPLGAFANRGVMDEGVLPGSGLVYDAVGGVTTCIITYKNYLGGVVP
jgi:hypothetical protein